MKLSDAIPIVRGITATTVKNNEMYVYSKKCFEDGSIRFLQQSIDISEEYKNEKISSAEYAHYIEADMLQVELSNIRQFQTDNGIIRYGRIEKGTKRDRATSLIYGLSVIGEMEEENRIKKHTKEKDFSQAWYVPTNKLGRFNRRKNF